MPRILFVGQSYITKESRKKLLYLARHADLSVSLIVPTTWEHESFGCYTFQPEPVDSPLDVIPIQIRRNGHVFAFSYDPIPLWHAIQNIRPDIFQVEQEPGSISLLQLVLSAMFQSRAKLVAFTWENLLHTGSLLRRLLESMELPRLDYLLVGSGTSARVFRAKGYRGRLAVLPNVGIDPEHFIHRPVPELRQSFDNRFVIGFAGRLVPEKGVVDLMHAFSQLPDDCHLWYVGGGILHDDLILLAQKLGIESRVTFQPTVSHVRVADYMNCMDCLVLPSRTLPSKWQEQFGLVLAQAMACGVPVIGSNSGAIPEVIGSAGLIFPEGDVTALRDYLTRLHDAPELRAELGKKGRAHVLANYTHEHIAERTYAIYQELLAQP